MNAEQKRHLYPRFGLDWQWVRGAIDRIDRRLVDLINQRSRLVVEVGDAGPGPSYLDAGGPDHPYTQRTTRWEPRGSSYAAAPPFSACVPKYISSGVRYSRL